VKVFWIQTDERYMAFNPAEIAWVDGQGRAYTVYMRDGKQIRCSFESGMTVRDFINTWDGSLRGEDVQL
jgi:hypothetical protein